MGREFTLANFRKILILTLWCSLLLLSHLIALGECKGKRTLSKATNNGQLNVIVEEKRTIRKSRQTKIKKVTASEAAHGRSKTRRVIVPVQKESFTSMAFRNINLLKSSLQSSADAAVLSTGKVQRQLKSYFSSDFEVMLLRMTTPDDLRLADDDLERFIATIETFVRNMDVTSQSNPYRVTLRKIWTKAAESDGRTVLKAQFILHKLLQGTTPEDSLIFKTLLRKMLREKCKKTRSKYFDIAKIASVSADTDHLKDFIGRYSLYIFQRAKTFTSSFEEMNLIGDGMRTEDICAQLMKAVKVLTTALNCSITSEEEENNIVLACAELVARDVRDLFTLYHAKLLWVLNEEKVGDIFTGWEIAEVRAILSHLKTFYCDRYEDIQEYLIETAAALQNQCNIALSVSLPSPATFEDNIPGSQLDEKVGSMFPSISHLESSSGGDSLSSSFSSFGNVEDS